MTPAAELHELADTIDNVQRHIQHAYSALAVEPSSPSNRDARVRLMAALQCLGGGWADDVADDAMRVRLDYAERFAGAR